MKRNIRKQFAMLLTLTTIITAVTATIDPFQAYAGTGSARYNAYYTEVSRLADSLTTNFKDETERQVCYDTIMTGVFGGNYQDWGSKPSMRGKTDLICVLSAEESPKMFQGFLTLYGADKYLDFHDGNHYYCMINKVELNAEGINEQNYNNLKTAYQTAEMLRAQTAQMGTVEKAKYIHDFLIDMLEHSDIDNPLNHNAFQALTTKKGICIVYTTLFSIFSRYCGLDTGTVTYDAKGMNMLHCYNTIILDNGEERCIDVLWDDTCGNDMYFLETVEANAISHPRE